MNQSPQAERAYTQWPAPHLAAPEADGAVHARARVARRVPGRIREPRDRFGAALTHSGDSEVAACHPAPEKPRVRQAARQSAAAPGLEGSARRKRIKSHGRGAECGH
jgi:hypothetical protein